LILITVAALTSCGVFSSERKRDFSNDAALAVTIIEEVHPIFIVDGLLPSDYEERKAAFLAETANPMTKTEFAYALRRFFTVLKDGNMDINDAGTGARFFGGGFADVRYTARDGRLYLKDEPFTMVEMVGGVDAADIFYQIDRHFYAENDSARDYNYEQWVGYEPFLRMAGSKVKGSAASQYSSEYSYRARHEMMGDVLYMSFNTFAADDIMGEYAGAVKNAVADGVWKFIVDLRGNADGSSQAGFALLDAMGITPPILGSMLRISETVRSQMAEVGVDIPPGTSMLMQRPPARPWLGVENPNNVYISVLTDKYTFGSATIFAAMVQDGRLGSVVGEPGRGAPTAFGDTVTFLLPDSGLEMVISVGRVTRADTGAEQAVLVPDIHAAAEMALETALRYLSNLEKRIPKQHD
jgi:hypothetical protein